MEIKSNINLKLLSPNLLYFIMISLN